MGFINFRAPLGNYENIQQNSTNTISGVVSIPLLSTGYYLASNWIAPKSGNITQIGVLMTAVSGTLPTVNIAIEGINSSKGANNTAISITGIDTKLSVSSGLYFFDIPSCAVTEGVGYCCTIRCTGAVSSSGCGFFGLLNQVSNGSVGYLNNFPVKFLGSISIPNGLPLIIPKYSDGIIPEGFFIANTGYLGYAGPLFSSGTALNMKGLLFQVPFECKIKSFAIATAQNSANSHTEVRIYGPNNNLICNRQFNAQNNFGGNEGCLLVEMPSGVIFKTNTNYRVIINPTGTSTLYSNFTSFNSNSDLLQFYGFSGCMTEGSGTGSNIAWKNYNNSTDGYRGWLAMPIVSEIPVAGRRRGRQ